MCKIIVDGETVEFEGSALNREDLFPYRAVAKHITICDSVTEIGVDAFHEFGKLASIEIPDSVKRIRSYAFVGCEAIKSIVIPNSITTIESGVFRSCRELKTIVLPESITDIKSGAFLGCVSLESVTIPNSVLIIERDAFSKCISLKNINVPKSVIKIGNSVFWGCDNIRVKIEAAKNVITPRAVMGRAGQIITVDIEGDEYPILTRRNLINDEAIVVMSFVDYADGKLYSGYEFNEELDPQSKVPLYCYCDASHFFRESTLSELKTSLEKEDIR